MRITFGAGVLGLLATLITQPAYAFAILGQGLGYSVDATGASNEGNIHIRRDLTFHMFDPALGTLNAVNIQISGSLAGFQFLPPHVVGSGLPPAVESYDASMDMALNFQGLSLFSFAQPTHFNIQSEYGDELIGLKVTDFTIRYAYEFTFDATTPGEIAPSFSSSGIRSAGVTQTDLVDGLLANFIMAGGGTKDLQTFFDITWPDKPPADLPEVGQATSFVEVDVNYLYTPAAISSVPEPSTMALLGIAFGGLALALRRRRDLPSPEMIA